MGEFKRTFCAKCKKVENCDFSDEVERVTDQIARCLIDSASNKNIYGEICCKFYETETPS